MPVCPPHTHPPPRVGAGGALSGPATSVGGPRLGLPPPPPPSAPWLCGQGGGGDSRFGVSRLKGVCGGEGVPRFGEGGSGGGVPVPYLELPVGRLQQLLGLVGGAAGRQHELVDHHLVLELVHGPGPPPPPPPRPARRATPRPHGAATMAEPARLTPMFTGH